MVSSPHDLCAQRTRTGLLSGLVLFTSLIAQAAPPAVPPPANSYPATIISLVDGQRFSEPAYFDLLASDGLRRIDGKVLFGMIGRAADRGELYKALYLATIFSEANPTLEAGCVAPPIPWTVERL